MRLLFQLLCTGYLAALMWTMYVVISVPGPTNRSPPLWVGIATALMVGLHFAFAPLLDPTVTMDRTATGTVPKDKFLFLLQLSGAVVVLQVFNPWLRRTFAHHAARQPALTAGAEKLLAVNAFLANKAIYVMMYFFQVLAIWEPDLV